MLTEEQTVIAAIRWGVIAFLAEIDGKAAQYPFTKYHTLQYVLEYPANPVKWSNKDLLTMDKYCYSLALELKELGGDLLKFPSVWLNSKEGDFPENWYKN